MKIDIKPLSVNKCWKGKRYKTEEYNRYERDLLLLLPKIDVPKPPLKVVIEFGFSSRASDTDNPVKPFVDILQKKYRFNDNKIFQYNLSKKIVKKGDEYIMFEIKSIK